jgi:hypothetical protein
MSDANLELLYETVLLNEGKKQSLSFLKSKNIPDEIANKIIELDSTPSKSDSLMLGKYFLENNNFNSIDFYYKKFIELKKKNNTLQINNYKTFHEFENFIDSQENQKGEINVEGEKSSEEIKKEAIYEDDNFEIYMADNIKKACDYGHKLGQSYSFCISRTGGGNLFSGYRLRGESTFYFIKSKNRSSNVVNGEYEDPSHMIVLDVMPNGRLMWTWADNGTQGHGTKETNWNEVFNELPELKIPYEKGVFKNVELSEEEKNKLEMFDGMSYQPSLTKFNQLSYNEKEEYIRSGFNIDLEIFNSLDKHLRNEYVNVGHPLDADFYNQLSEPEKIRWEKVRLQIIENEL